MRVFHPKAVTFSINRLTKWSSCLERHARDTVRYGEGVDTADTNVWHAFASTLASYHQIQQLKALKRWLSAFKYQSEEVDCWLTPLEFIKKGGGDCEDFAIAGYFVLKAAGWNTHDMRLSCVSQDVGRDHLFLCVNTEKEEYAIDSRFSLVTKTRSMKNYLLLYACNEHGAWHFSHLNT